MTGQAARNPAGTAKTMPRQNIHDAIEGAVIGPEALVLRWLDESDDDRLLLFNLGRDFDWHPVAEPLRVRARAVRLRRQRGVDTQPAQVGQLLDSDTRRQPLAPGRRGETARTRP